MEKVEYVVAIHKHGIPDEREVGKFTNLEDAKDLMRTKFLELITKATNESLEAHYGFNEFTQYDVYVKKDEGGFSYVIDSEHTPMFRYGMEITRF